MPAIMPRVLAVSAQMPGLGPAPTTLPWKFTRAGNGNRLTVLLDVSWATPRTWTLIPDDYLRWIRVNGAEVPLESVRPGGLEDYSRGFDYDFSPWLRPGENRIEIGLDNRAGQGGLFLRPRFGWRAVLVGVSFVPWLLLLGRWFGLDRRQLVACVGGLALLMVYWSHTPWTLRTHDVNQHLEYVEFLLSKHRIPPPFGGWSFFHPPLYYLGAALVVAASRALLLLGYESLQAYALVLWLVFLVASAGAIRVVLTGKQRLFATLALVAWPSGIIHGLRIGNDSMLYACSGVATFFLVAWWHDDRRGQLWWAAFFAGLGMLAKTNSMILVVALGLLFVQRNFAQARWRQGRTWLEGGVAFVLVTAGVLGGLGNGIYWYWRGKIPNWLVANVGSLPEQLRVPVDVASFLPLDIPTFLTEPFQDRGRREGNFWNAMFRSSLSGEFNYPDPLPVLGYFWGACLLLLLVLLLRRAWGLVRSPRLRFRHAPWLWLSAGWIVSLMVLRYKTPFSCSNDFRYVLPVLVPFVIACVRSGTLARVVLLALVAGTVPFVLGL